MDAVEAKSVDDTKEKQKNKVRQIRNNRGCKSPKKHIYYTNNRCKALKEYMTLINYIRANQADGMKVEDAVEKAVIRCIEEKILEKILKKNRAEVVSVCITEYNEEVFINGIKEEGREEGKIIAIIKISRKYSATDEQCIENIMNELKVTREKAEEHYRKYSKNIEEN